MRTVPIQGKLDSHLDEMIPGYRDPKHRPQPIKSDQIDQNDDVTVTESQLDETMQMHEQRTTEQPNPDTPQQPLNKQNNNQIQLPNDFYDRLKLCRDYCAQLFTNQNHSQTLEIENLRKEVAALKAQKETEDEKHGFEFSKLKEEMAAFKVQKETDDKNHDLEINTLKTEVAALKQKCENHVKEITECKLSEWCQVCLSKLDNENTITLCPTCTEVF